VLVYSLDLTKNKAAVWAMNSASLPLLILSEDCSWRTSGWSARAWGGAAFRSGYRLVVSGGFDCFIRCLDRGARTDPWAFFWVFTRSRPVFGLRGWYAFAAAPGWFLTRGQYLVTILAPFLILSVLGHVPDGNPAGFAGGGCPDHDDLQCHQFGWRPVDCLPAGRPNAILWSLKDRGDGVNFYSLNRLQTEVKP